MLKVKVTLMSAVEPEMRRMSLGDNPDFDEFKKKVSELFNETDTELLFQWKDSEDDMITMSSEEEFQEALKNISDGLLRIFIKRMNADCTNGLKEGNVDHENSYFRMNMDSDTDVRPRVWERRLGRGKGCGIGWRSFDASPARRRGCSERREWRRMRRALKFSERFDKPKHGCRRFQRRDAIKHEDRRNWMSSDDVFPEGGMEEYRWTDRSVGCRKIRRCQRSLDMSTDGCRQSRMRKRENMYEMARGIKHCRRANSAPPARFYDENVTRCGRRMRKGFEQARRCRSASLPPRERSSAFSAGSCRRQRFGYPKRTFLIKLKVKNVQNRGYGSDDESGCNRERKCLGRRCKSYRRRAMMEAEKVKENVDAPVTPEEDMEPRMNTLSLNDDGLDDDMQKDQQDGTGKRERRCKRRKHTYQEDGEEENERPERRRGNCHRKCRNKYERNGDGSQPQENTSKEKNEIECSDQERSERRRQMREYRRALREKSGAECSHTSGKGDRSYHKYVTLKVNMDRNMRPKKLARKLFKIFKQETDMDGETPNDEERNHGHEDWSRKDFDWPRYHGMRRRQARGFRRFRAMQPEFSRRDVGGFRPRGWYRKDCPW